MSFTFPKTLRIRTRRHYKWMCYASKRLAGNTLLFDVKKNSTTLTRLGITVTKKFGKAHDRNRFKRLVKEVFRTHYQTLPKGIDIHVRPALFAKKATFQDIIKDFTYLTQNELKFYERSEPKL